MIHYYVKTAVKEVEVIAVNATAVNVSWNALIISDVHVDNYTVVYSNSQDREMNVVFSVHITSGVITNLSVTEFYQFQVFVTVTVNGRSLDGERSAPVNFIWSKSMFCLKENSNYYCNYSALKRYFCRQH